MNAMLANMFATNHTLRHGGDIEDCMIAWVSKRDFFWRMGRAFISEES